MAPSVPVQTVLGRTHIEMPVDEEEGTATVASSIVFGDYRQLMIGMRSQLEIRVDDQPLASTGQMLVVAWLRADIQLAQPKSFCTLTGMSPAQFPAARGLVHLTRATARVREGERSPAVVPLSRLAHSYHDDS